MELMPNEPPGRGTRKARAYTAEIQRLASLGYTLEVIRKALQEAGVTVSKSTIQREAKRHPWHQPERASPQAPAEAAPQPAFSVSSAEPGAAPLAPSNPAPPSSAIGHNIAEMFFKANPSTPLLQHQEDP